ncbi:hypothetical protein GGX14DRAFT_666051 [Mycena pura]|uniref:Calpain catalytic domain-containing protein n=1 Tax=Mycena pura TaxID=153505 RepID=A0AAD6UZA0_9AGAR|nr:hypothetical protein GGX14DRAFT_666051 [Mycena pura]
MKEEFLPNFPSQIEVGCTNPITIREEDMSQSRVLVERLPLLLAMPSAEDAESTYAKAVKAEYSKDLDTAFRLYVKAAESFLHLSRSVDQREKTKWKTSAGKALERAEKIKSFVEKSKPSLSDPSSTSETRLTPVGVDHFSPHEQFYAVKKGANINGRTFPLWDDPFPISSSLDIVFEDPDGDVSLSPEQLKVSPHWRRPHESGALAVSESNEGTDDTARLRPQDIFQHIITDCSLCASISVCLEHSQRCGSQFGYISLHAPDASASLVSPISQSASSKGRYDLRLLFNGAWRRIGAFIDDKLPYHPTTDALVCMSSTRGAIWPSLLEKGYMKLMGGYDFPGSNSSIDLHALVGWIPEHLEIKSPSFERERTWRRILNAFLAGRCMLTVGTGTNSNLNWRGVSLLSSHSYAVIDIKEDDTSRGFTVLDSWIRTNTDAKRDSRTLDIPWSDIVEIFDSIYLSWDPRIWPESLNFHGKQGLATDARRIFVLLDLSKPHIGSTRNLRVKYQSTIRNAEDEVWILLTRHVADIRRSSDFISLRVELEDNLGRADVGGQQRRIATKGTYTNSTHVLVKTRLPNQTHGILSIFVSYDGQAAEVGFAVSVHSPEAITIAWDKRVLVPPFSSKARSFALLRWNAGGNSAHPTFMANPQYHLRIYPPKHARAATKADVALTMQMARDVPINIAVVWSQGERAFELTHKDLAASSVGDYTVILSAFEPNQLGPFSLEVESSLAFDLKAIPQEGAGMYTKTICGAWNAQNAMGGPSFKHYAQNPRFEIDVQAPTELKIRLQLLRPTTLAAVNVTLFPTSQTGVLGRHIATSGGYDDSIAGVVMPQVALAVGKYWVVPSTYAPAVQGSFQLVVYSTAAAVSITERSH